MASRSWKKETAVSRIDARIKALPIKDIEIRRYVRDTDLANLPQQVVYLLDGVHLYADILNMSEMLHVTDVEGETCHRRTLRFLNLHYRAVHRILQQVDAIFVDFHNQRLHAVVAKPYDSEAARVEKAVAVGQLIIEVLAQTGEGADYPAAKLRIGIDTGKALAVNNGRRGHREPLFLGEPANHAAKRAGGGTATGIYLTNKARKTIGLATVSSEDANALTREQIINCWRNAKLPVTCGNIVKQWQEDLKANPIGSFEFSVHTPPFKNLDIETLSVRNSRRQDAATIYADIDGFTAFVGRNISDDLNAKHVVRTLHVLRSELDAVLHEDFAGRKVRFIGDCVHGLVVEGTAQATDIEETITNMALGAAAMRSSFDLAINKLREAGTNASSLGLAIGFEFGPMNVTQLGMKGELVRCSVSRGVLAAEREQSRCAGSETAIGATAHGKASIAVQGLFGPTRKRSGLTYEVAVREIAEAKGNARKVREASGLLKFASAAAAPPPYAFPDRRTTPPAKPAGFA